MLAAAPLAAQDNAADSAPPAAPAANIGPQELSNFSLNGRVTREAQPVAQPPATSTAQPAARSAPTTSPQSRQSRSEPPAVAEAQPRRVRADAASVLDARPTPPPRNARSAAAAAASSGLTAPAASLPLPPESSSGFSPLPWIAALLLLGAGAVIYFGRKRQQPRYAAPGPRQFAAPASQPVAPSPRQQQSPRSAAPPPSDRERLAPAPTPSRPPTLDGVVTSSLRAPGPPAGVISSSLRPWIEVELEPSQALVTNEHAAIAFDVTLFNSGSAPARDVAIDACLINAGQQQDVELSDFYRKPGETADKIPAVAPMSRITLKSAVRLPRDAVQEYEVEGRKLFMPMVAVNSRYRWSSGEGQSGASFLVGRAASSSDKLAPLRLDQGARGWKQLAARRYEKGIRR